MKGIISAIILLVCTVTSTPANSKEVQQQSSYPKEVYYEFIKSVNPRISQHKMKEIFRAVEYYTPRYFGEDGKFEEGLLYVMSMMAQESTFINQNGDEGKSIGYLMVQIPTCNVARKYNNIRKEMNLISMWDNIHCGMAEFNRLTEYYDHDWELSVRAYNAGTGGVRFWLKYKGRDISHLNIKTQKAWKRLDYMTNRHWEKVTKYRNQLLSMVWTYKNLTAKLKM